MSDTPLTDALVQANRESGVPCTEAIDSEIVRMMERENTALRESLREMIALGDRQEKQWFLTEAEKAIVAKAKELAQ